MTKHSGESRARSEPVYFIDFFPSTVLVLLQFLLPLKTARAFFAAGCWTLDGIGSGGQLWPLLAKGQPQTCGGQLLVALPYPVVARWTLRREGGRWCEVESGNLSTFITDDDRILRDLEIYRFVIRWWFSGGKG